MVIKKKPSKSASVTKTAKVVTKPIKAVKVVTATKAVTKSLAAKAGVKKTSVNAKALAIKSTKTVPNKAAKKKTPMLQDLVVKKDLAKGGASKAESVKKEPTKKVVSQSGHKALAAKVTPLKKTSSAKVAPVKTTLKSKLMMPLKAAVAKLAPKSTAKAVETKRLAVKPRVEKSQPEPATPKPVAKKPVAKKPAASTAMTKLTDSTDIVKSPEPNALTKTTAQASSVVKSMIKPEASPTSKKSDIKKTEMKKEKLIESPVEVSAVSVPREAVGKTAVMKPQFTVNSTSAKGSSLVSIDMTDEAVLSPLSKEAAKPIKAQKIIKVKAPKNHTDSPADFQPYQAESDEEYMNTEQLAHFRGLLNKWKQELMEEVDRTVHHMQDESANLPDPADRATQEEEFTFELRTRDRERKLIKKIDQALEALDDNDYGYCESCGVEIGIRRLEARPTATLCIDCKTLDEIKEKQLRGS